MSFACSIRPGSRELCCPFPAARARRHGACHLHAIRKALIRFIFLWNFRNFLQELTEQGLESDNEGSDPAPFRAHVFLSQPQPSVRVISDANGVPRFSTDWAPVDTGLFCCPPGQQRHSFTPCFPINHQHRCFINPSRLCLTPVPYIPISLFRT